MRSLFKAAFAVAALGLAGGCFGGGNLIVGFIVNGQTGERINIFKNEGGEKPENQNDDDASKSQVYAVIDGRFTRAVPCDAGDANEENGIQPDGCYMIEGIPFDQQIPIFAQIEGFERFHGTVSPITTSEFQDDNQRVANIRVFPLNYAVSYSVFVHHSGTPLNGATVMCQIRQNSNTLRTDGNFLPPENTTSAAISLTTDGEGNALIEGNRLVNGASYHCEAFRSDLFNGKILSGEADFVAGVDVNAITISTSQSGGSTNIDEPLYALRSNADSADDLLGDGAGLTVWFNRPVEFVPRTQDCHDASFSAPDYDGDGRATPTLRTYEDNGASESVTSTLSGDGMMLTLNYRFDGSFDPDDLGTTVTFSGVYLRPIGLEDGTVVRRIGGPGAPCSEAGGLSASGLRSARLGGGSQPATIRLF